MTVDVNEAKDGGILRDKYGREQLVAVDKHAVPSITDLPIPDGYTDADGRRQVVLATPTGATLQSVESDVAASRKWFPVPTIDDTANLGAYIAANDEIQLRAGTHNVSSLDLTGAFGKKIRGVGQKTVFIVNGTTGHGIDMSNASFVEWSDMYFRQGPSQRTAGELFYVDAAGGASQRNAFRRLRIGNGLKNFNLRDTGTAVLEELEFTDVNPAWPMESLIHLSGASKSLTLDKLVGGTAVACTNAFIHINGPTVDTIHGSDWNLLSWSGGSSRGLWIVAGQWINLVNCSIECGATFDALTVSGGRGITITAPHFIGRICAVIAGGLGVDLIGGELLHADQNAITLSASGTRFKATSVKMHDLSQASSGTYTGVRVVGGVSDFEILGCDIGYNTPGYTSQCQYGIRVEPGASDNYVLAHNRLVGATGKLLDGGTGLNKYVAGNI